MTAIFLFPAFTRGSNPFICCGLVAVYTFIVVPLVSGIYQISPSSGRKFNTGLNRVSRFCAEAQDFLVSLPCIIFFVGSMTVKLVLLLPVIYRDFLSVKDFVSQILFFFMLDDLCNRDESSSAVAAVATSLMNIVAISLLCKSIDPQSVSMSSKR